MFYPPPLERGLQLIDCHPGLEEQVSVAEIEFPLAVLILFDEAVSAPVPQLDSASATHMRLPDPPTQKTHESHSGKNVFPGYRQSSLDFLSPSRAVTKGSFGGINIESITG